MNVEHLARELAAHLVLTRPLVCVDLEATGVHVDQATRQAHEANSDVEATVAFGQQAGISLAELAVSDRSFLEWILTRTELVPGAGIEPTRPSRDPGF